MESLYYIASKTFWLFFQPINFLILLVVVGTLMLFSRRRLLARRILVGSSMTLALIAFTPVGFYGLDLLESKHKRQPLPEHVDGIIVLGGGVDWLVSNGRDLVELGVASDRIVESVVLSRKFPNAKFVYTGRQGPVVDVKSLLVALGMDATRIQVEARSRNTIENVRFSYELVQPDPKEVWLVVTSAFHMKRAVELFNEMQWNVAPWPVDFRSPGADGHYPFFYDTPTAILNVNTAFKKWVGLLFNKSFRFIKNLLVQLK